MMEKRPSMHTQDMTQTMSEFLEQCLRVLTVKNRDYHPDDVPMLEVLQTSFETGIRPEQDLWGRLRKQLAALRRYVVEGHLEAAETPEQRMIDVTNYTALLHFWIYHNQPIVENAIYFVEVHRRCECEGDRCERCLFLEWLHKLRVDLKSRALRSPLTPRPPD